MTLTFGLSRIIYPQANGPGPYELQQQIIAHYRRTGQELYEQTIQQRKREGKKPIAPKLLPHIQNILMGIRMKPEREYIRSLGIGILPKRENQILSYEAPRVPVINDVPDDMLIKAVQALEECYFLQVGRGLLIESGVPAEQIRLESSFDMSPGLGPDAIPVFDIKA